MIIIVKPKKSHTIEQIIYIYLEMPTIGSCFLEQVGKWEDISRMFFLVLDAPMESFS
jgi:hypothetical protein